MLMQKHETSNFGFFSVCFRNPVTCMNTNVFHSLFCWLTIHFVGTELALFWSICFRSPAAKERGERIRVCPSRFLVDGSKFHVWWVDYQMTKRRWNIRCKYLVLWLEASRWFDWLTQPDSGLKSQDVTNFKLMWPCDHENKCLCTVETEVGGTPEGRILAGYHGFNANISFTFQAITNLSAHHPTYLRFGLFCIFCVILGYIWIWIVFLKR